MQYCRRFNLLNGKHLEEEFHPTPSRLPIQNFRTDKTELHRETFEIIPAPSRSVSFAVSTHLYGVGRRATAAQVAEQLPKAPLQARIVAGAVAPSVAPQVHPAAA